MGWSFLDENGGGPRRASEEVNKGKRPQVGDSAVVFGETNPNFFNDYMGAQKNDGGPTAKRKSAQMTQMSEWSRGSDLAKRSQFLEC